MGGDARALAFRTFRLAPQSGHATIFSRRKSAGARSGFLFPIGTLHSETSPRDFRPMHASRLPRPTERVYDTITRTRWKLDSPDLIGRPGLLVYGKRLVSFHVPDRNYIFLTKWSNPRERVSSWISEENAVSAIMFVITDLNLANRAFIV